MSLREKFVGRSLLVPVFFPLWSVHYEAALEIAQRALDEGLRVTILICNGIEHGCDSNVTADKSICLQCVARQRRGLPLLDPRAETIQIDGLDVETHSEILRQMEQLETLEDWARWCYDGFDVGTAVHSSLASAWNYGDHRPDVESPGVRETFETLSLAALTVFESVRRILAQGHFDQVIVFNGRLAIPRAVIRACQDFNVHFSTHERGPTLDRFLVVPDDVVHSNSALRRQILELAHRTPAAERQLAATRFFNERRKGVFWNWNSITGKDHTFLDDSYAEVIAFFLTSETEWMRLIPEAGSTDPFPTQENALADAVQTCRRILPNTHVVIRMHPFSQGQTRQVKAVKQLEARNVTVLLPESRIDSYSLLDRAKTVISFGSTMGIEASYWGKPSILIGDAPYRTLGSTYEPESIDEFAWLVSQDLQALDTWGAEAFGLYNSLGGYEFKYASESVLGQALFKEQDLGKRPLPSRLLHRIQPRRFSLLVPRRTTRAMRQN